MNSDSSTKIPLSHYLHLASTYLKPQKYHVLLLATLLFSSIGLQLINPQIMRHFIDSAQTGSALQTLLLAAGMYLGVAIIQQLTSVSATYVGENVGWAATNQMRFDLVKHCLRLDMSFHNKKTPGEMIERIDGDVAALSNMFSKFIVQILGNFLLLIGILVALAQIDWRSSISFTVFVVIAMLVLNSLRFVVVPSWMARSKANAEFFSFLEERIQGTEDVRANGGVPYVMQRFTLSMRNRVQKERKALMINALSWSTTTMVFLIGNAIALGIGFYLFKSDTITLGTVYMIFFYTEMLRQPLSVISTQFAELQKATASFKRIGELTSTQSKIQDGPGAEIPSGSPALTFEKVSFGYHPDDLILQDISFHLQAGKVLGLIGRTGSGKTTLGRLLFRLYDQTEGRVLVNGVDIRQARIHDLRSRIGMVTQDVQLFRASIRDNLTFFDETISDDAILNVLRDLGMSEWYDSLSHGLDTELDAEGGGLSAGEAQLLALARVFLRNPDLVILDEASSRLDPNTEQLLERAMDKLLENRTAIIIAHRLSTIKRADDIMVLENGKILEHGTRQELAVDPTSRLSKMLKTGLEVESL